MIFQKKYINLYACCIPTKGASRSIVIDTQRNNFFFIPNELYDIITKQFNKPINEVYSQYDAENHEILNEYFNFLINNELAFYTNEPEHFPEISQKWESPRIITNAILDINSYTTYNLKDVIKQVDELGAEALQLRIYSVISLDKFEEILHIIKNDTNRLRIVEIVLKYEKYTEGSAFTDLLDDFKILSEIIIHSSPYNQRETNPLYSKVFTKELIESETKCGCISPTYFSPTLEHITESIHFNSCLNRKISVNDYGEIKNCPSMKESFGNVKNIKLISVLKNKHFVKNWNISKDQILVCKDCEFRLICNDCRAYLNNIYDKPAKCGYDPYTAEWNK